MKILIMLFSLMSLSAFALEIGNFEITPTFQGKVHENYAHEFDRDWSCAADIDLKYNEIKKNHKGEDQSIKRDQSKALRQSLVYGGLITSQLSRDLSIETPLIFQVHEHCTQYKEKNGKKKSIDEYVSWVCEFKSLPKKINESTMVTCVQKDIMGPSYYSQFFTKNVVKAKATLKSITETYSKDLCKGKDLSKRKVIKISEGLHSLVSEDDLVLKLKIEGIDEEIRIENEDGMFNDEIVVCLDNVHITASAVEEDIIWDDIYYCEDGKESTKFQLSTKSQDFTSKEVTFNRPGSWLLEKVLLDQDQKVKFEIRDAPKK